MIQPVEMRAMLPMKLRGGVMTTTTDVWTLLTACLEGDLDRVEASLATCPALVTCDYNYMAPLHVAVREGHADLVRYLADRNAANPAYVTYPYRETLVTVARDRGLEEIAHLLEERYRNGDRTRPEDEGGEIDYGMTAEQQRFQKLLNGTDTTSAESMLQERPELARNPFAFWSEGVLMMPANRGHRKMIELLLRYGARVPDVTKWGSWYYLKNDDIAEFLLDQGMNANHMNCHHTTVLHDMAYKGDVRKATLLLDHGAEINAVDEEWRSTPLGLAARWGHREMVALLLERGADPRAAGAPWATPAEWAAKKGHAEVLAMLRRAG
jgi:ankyrin repeat protein